MPTLIEKLAAWAAVDRRFPEAAIERAADAVADTLGCILAGVDDPVTRAVRMTMTLAEASGAPVVGGGLASPPAAAFVNGTAAHALDFDDNYRPARAHASAVLVPALLAAAPDDASGRDLIDACIVGYEAQAVIGEGLGGAHYHVGWHPTSTTGLVGSAVAVARLMGLDQDGIAAATSNATSFAAGFKRQFGTPMKPVHAGLAARGAVEAALLARAGISGDLAALDGERGMLDLFGTPESPGWAEDLAVGAPLALVETGLAPKVHPCCGSAHWALDMLFDLKRTHGFAASDVRGMVARIGPTNYLNLSFERPETGMQARFSMHYGLAVALLQDELALSDFEDAAVARQEVRDLLPLTRMEAHTVEAEDAAGQPLPHTLRVTLADGRVLEAEREEVRGTIVEPFSREETRRKFVSCVAFAGGSESEAGRLHARLLALPAAGDLSAVDAVFALPLVRGG